MKLYILRHEDKTQDATFFSPLTKQGLENATKLINELEKVEISHIYSSPYIRTLQTVHPYCKKHDLKIKLEYGLSEINHEDIIPKKSYQIRLPEYIACIGDVSRAAFRTSVYGQRYVRMRNL